MLRSLIAGVLVLSAVPACGKSSDAPAVVAGATAGKVIAAEGDVTATRGDATRKLSTGDAISGDDVIKTAAGASVRIWLSHNNATWSLEENRSGSVGESAAWKLARVDKRPDGVDEATTAAGRYSERSAADTSATAKEAAPAAAAAEEAAQDLGSAPGSLDQSKQPPPAPPVRPSAAATAPPPPKPPDAGRKQQKHDVASERDEDAPARDVAAPAQTRSRPVTGGASKNDAVENDDDFGAMPASDKSSKGAGGGTESMRRPAESEPIAQEIDIIARDLQPKLQKCVAATATLVVKLVVRDGKLTIEAPRASAKELACMNDIAKTQKVTGPDASKALALKK